MDDNPVNQGISSDKMKKLEDDLKALEDEAKKEMEKQRIKREEFEVVKQEAGEPSEEAVLKEEDTTTQAKIQEKRMEVPQPATGEMPASQKLPQEAKKADGGGVKLILWIIPAVLIAFLFTAGGYYLGIKSVKTQPTPISKPSTLPVVPTPTPDPTADWGVYTNTSHDISFKYPASWALKETSGQEDRGQIFNTEVKLTKQEAIITIILNVDGIGGMPQTYEGNRFMLDGNSLYQFRRIDDNNNMKIVGISNSLTTLGVFDIGGITHLITLAYPEDYESAMEEIILGEFDQILSTFRFLESTPSTDTTETSVPSITPYP